MSLFLSFFKSKIRQLENENHILSTNVGNFSKNGDEEESYNDTVSKCKQIVQKLKSYQGAKEPQDIISNGKFFIVKQQIILNTLSQLQLVCQRTTVYIISVKKISTN